MAQKQLRNHSKHGKISLFCKTKVFLPYSLGYFKVIMTYSAPNRTLFLIILLISLFLHTVFFVISSDRQTTEQHRVVAERLVAELGAELAMPSAANDRVSMSHIAGQYAQEPQVAFVAIYDADDNIVVSIGEGENGYRTRNETIVVGDKVLGSVVLETKAVSTATILSGQWLFLLAMLVIHGLLWVVYGHIARPTKELKLQIARQTRDRLLSQGLLTGEVATPTPTETPPTPSEDSASAEPASAVDTTKADASEDDTDQQTVSTPPAVDSYTVQVRFDDPNQLIQAVSYDHKKMYFAMCDQMVSKAATKLLETPLLAGVSIRAIKSFDETGASIELVRDNDYAKVATAALMLSKLILMVNQIVYDRHRELGQFALKFATTASDTAQANTIYSISKRRGQPLLVLFEPSASQEVAIFGTLTKIHNPSSPSERNCQIITSMSQSTVSRLRVARDAVFLDD